MSSLQFESIAEEKAQQEIMDKEMKQEDTIEFWTTKVGPLLTVLILGLAALLVIKDCLKFLVAAQNDEPYDRRAFEAQLPTIKDEPTDLIDSHSLPQLEAHLDPELERVRMELNDTILADPAEAARLLTSYVKD